MSELPLVTPDMVAKDQVGFEHDSFRIWMSRATQLVNNLIVNPTPPPPPVPGGIDKQVQFNDAGVLAGDPGLTYNKTTDKLSVGVGIGVGAAPKAWGAGQFAMDMGATGHIRGDNATCEFGSNLIFDGATWRTVVAGTGMLAFTTISGVTRFGLYSTPSAAAGAAVSPTEKFRVNDAGSVQMVDGTAVAPSISFMAEPQTGFYRAGGNIIDITIAGVLCYRWHPTVFAIKQGATIAWWAAGYGSFDVAIGANSVGKLEVNNGTAGTFRDIVVRDINGAGAAVFTGTVKGSAVNGLYIYAGAFSGALDFRVYQTVGMTAGSTVTSLTGTGGQVARILVNGAGPVNLPATLKWAVGSPVWGTVVTFINMWTDGTTWWATTVPYNT